MLPPEEVPLPELDEEELLLDELELLELEDDEELELLEDDELEEELLLELEEELDELELPESWTTALLLVTESAVLATTTV